MKFSARVLGSMIFAATILWSASLVAFASALPKEVSVSPSYTDAIVVPTGGYGRLLEGVKLLREGRAERLFISGVNNGLTLPILLGEISNGLEGCCVDLGHTARDTFDNAYESASWMAKWQFRSLLLVTDNYHMPRAILEFRHAMPNVKLVANPVFPEHVKVDNWWRYRGTAGLVASEYAKYLLAFLRAPFTRVSPDNHL